MFTTLKDGRRANLTSSERLLVDLERRYGGRIDFLKLILGGSRYTEPAYKLARLALVAFEGPKGKQQIVLTDKGRAAAQRLHVVEIH